MTLPVDEYQKREIIFYKNLPAWPDFNIYDKNIDGLIPSAKLESWEQFHEVVKNYRVDEDGAEYVFRGQHNYTWALQPTLDRMAPGAIQEDIARKQLRNFRLSIRGRVPDNAVFNEREEELWAIGQHHGLATPLLDWTLAPYVALFFAFVNEDPESWNDDNGDKTNYSRAIYILNKSFIEDLVGHDDDSPTEQGYPKIVEPSKDDHGRLVNQAGLFTISPYGETIESALFKALVDSSVDIDDPKTVSKYICKLHIPNSSEFRRDCLRHLRKMNIHFASLFPDLIGASGYCNELIRDAIENKSKLNKTNSITLAIDSTGLVKTEPLVNDFIIAESNEVLKTLLLSLLVDGSVKEKTSESQLKDTSKIALDFIENKAGVDWFVRPSQISRLKNIVRRQLKKIGFPDDYLIDAANSLAFTVAKMSYEEDRKKGLQKGLFIDVPSKNNLFDEIWSAEKE